ncbi:MAG: FG-GAP-like repeat-containing protein [Patescibacteria group bacterium]
MAKKSTLIFILLFVVVFVLLGMLFTITRAQAATGTVTGSVKLSDGTTSAGVGITVVVNSDTWPRITGATASDVTDAGGNFSITVNEGTGYKVWAVADSDTAYGNSSSATVDVAAGGTVSAGNLSLTDLQFKGRITYPDGSGVGPGSLVEVHTPAGDVWKRDELDSNGKYSIGGLAVGSNYAWEIQLDSSITGYTKPQGQNVTVTDGMTALEINATLIAAPKHITGTVSRPDGSPVSGALVQACPDKNPNLACSSDNTDATGTYDLYLSSGTWHMTMGPDLSDSTADWVYFGFPETVTFSGEAVETLTKNFTVTKADAKISGLVKLASGANSINSDIQCYTSEGKGSVRKTDQSGIFGFYLPAGSYRCAVFSLDTDGRDQVFSEIKTTLLSGVTRDLGVIQGKARTSHVTGRAHLSTGEGAQGTDIVLWQKDGVGKQRVVAGDNGTYDALVVPGKWVVGVENGHSYYLYDDLKEVEITADFQTVSGIDIQVARNEANVVGTLKDEAGNTVVSQGGAVYIRDAQGNYKFTGSVDANGSYSFAVPTEMLGGNGATVYLGWQPEPNATYSFLAEKSATLVQKGAPLAGSFMFEDVAVNVEVKRDDKTVSGGFVDQYGNSVSPDFAMKVMASDGRGNVRVVDVAAGGYSFSVCEGTWNITYKITDEDTGYINPVNKYTTAEVNPADANVTKQVAILKADAVISGTLKDEEGVAVPYTSVYVTNHKAIEGRDKDLIKVEGYTDGSGNYTLNVAGDETYQVGAGEATSISSNAINPDYKESKPARGSSAIADLQYQESDAVISGQVTKGGKAVSSGFVQAWSDEGAQATAEIDLTGRYEIKATKNDHWHVKAAEIDGQSLYLSLTADKTPSGSEIVNLSLSKSEFTVPAPEVRIFDANNPISVTLSDGTTITAPDKAFDSEGEITLTVSPKIDITSSDSSKPLSLGYDMKVKDSDGKEIISFLKPVSISFHYTDDQLDELGVDADELETSYLDEVNNLLKSTGFAAANPQTNTITVYSDHFTAFGLTSPYAKGMVSRKASIILTPKKANSKVIAYNQKGKKVFSFTPYPSSYSGEFEVISADVNGDKKAEIITATGSGMKSYIRVWRVITKKNNKKKIKHLSSFYAYGKKFKKGVNLTAADFDRDKKYEIIVAPQSGNKKIKIYQYNSKKKKFSLFKKIKAYEKSFKGGISLGVGDVNNDGKVDLITAPQSYTKKKTKVKVYIYNSNTKKFQLLAKFCPYPKKFFGGIEIKVGDVNGDQQKEIITAPNNYFGPLVKIYQYNLTRKKMNLLAKYYVFKKNYKNGINLEVADLNDDGKEEMVVGPNDGYKPQVRVLSYQNKKMFKAKNFRAYKKTYQKGIELELADVNNNGFKEIIVASQKGTARVKIYKASGKKAKLLKKFLGFPKSYQNGVNLASGIF